MKIFIKTLKGDKQDIEVALEDTVLSLKQKVQALQGHEPEQQKLIAFGRIMEDAKLLSEYNLKEGDNIVIMVAKPKPQPRVQAPQPEVASQPVREAGPAAVAPGAGGVNTMATGPEFEASVQRVMELGFPRDQVEVALRAAFGNPDRAIDYLTTGIPSQLGEGQPMEQEEAGGEEEDPNEEVEAGDNPFAFLQGNPALNEIRRQLQQNPESLRSLIQQISANNPELAQLIAQHPQEFIRFMLEPSGPQIDPQLINALPRPNQIQLTREEVEAIRNLASLGFSEEDALEAFISCDKNEAMAANLLFENYVPLAAQQAQRPAPPGDPSQQPPAGGAPPS